MVTQPSFPTAFQLGNSAGIERVSDEWLFKCWVWEEKFLAAETGVRFVNRVLGISVSQLSGDERSCSHGFAVSGGGEGCDTAWKALCGSKGSLINLLVPCWFERDPPNSKAKLGGLNTEGRNEITVHTMVVSVPSAACVLSCSEMSLPVTVQDGVYPVSDG